MENLRLLYEAVGEGLVVGDVFTYPGVRYHLKILEYTINGSISFNSGVAYLKATEDTLQLMSNDKNLVLEVEDGQRFFFEFTNVSLGKITIRFKRQRGA